MALINTIMYMGGLGLIETNEGHGWENLIFLLSFFVMTAARKHPSIYSRNSADLLQSRE